MMDFCLDNNCLVNLDPGTPDEARDHDSASALRELVERAPENVWFSWESSSERGPGGTEPERVPARFCERLQRIGIAERQGVSAASVLGHMRLNYSRLPMENEDALLRSLEQVLLDRALVDESRRNKRCDVLTLYSFVRSFRRLAYVTDDFEFLGAKRSRLRKVAAAYGSDLTVAKPVGALAFLRGPQGLAGSLRDRIGFKAET